MPSAVEKVADLEDSKGGAPHVRYSNLGEVRKRIGEVARALGLYSVNRRTTRGRTSAMRSKSPSM